MFPYTHNKIELIKLLVNNYYRVNYSASNGYNVYLYDEFDSVGYKRPAYDHFDINHVVVVYADEDKCLVNPHDVFNDKLKLKTLKYLLRNKHSDKTFINLIFVVNDEICEYDYLYKIINTMKDYRDIFMKLTGNQQMRLAKKIYQTNKYDKWYINDVLYMYITNILRTKDDIEDDDKTDNMINKYSLTYNFDNFIQNFKCFHIDIIQKKELIETTIDKNLLSEILACEYFKIADDDKQINKLNKLIEKKNESE